MILFARRLSSLCTAVSGRTESPSRRVVAAAAVALCVAKRVSRSLARLAEPSRAEPARSPCNDEGDECDDDALDNTRIRARALWAEKQPKRNNNLFSVFSLPVIVQSAGLASRSVAGHSDIRLF